MIACHLVCVMGSVVWAAQPMQYDQSFLRGRTKVDLQATFTKIAEEDPTKIEGTLLLSDSNLVGGKWTVNVTRKVKLSYLQDGTTPDVVHLAGTIVESPFADEKLREIHVTEHCPGKTIEFYTPAHRIERMGFIHACGKLAKVAGKR